MFTNIYNKIKDWFKHSESIFIARLEVLVGFLLAAIEGMDWSALLSLDFSNAVFNKQFLGIGMLVIAKGIVSEWARRRNSGL